MKVVFTASVFCLLFSQLKLAAKTVMLFTNSDDPHAHSPELKVIQLIQPFPGKLSLFNTFLSREDLFFSVRAHLKAITIISDLLVVLRN